MEVCAAWWSVLDQGSLCGLRHQGSCGLTPQAQTAGLFSSIGVQAQRHVKTSSSTQWSMAYLGPRTYSCTRTRRNPSQSPP